MCVMFFLLCPKFIKFIYLCCFLNNVLILYLFSISAYWFIIIY